jgi:acyl carrier protein
MNNWIPATAATSALSTAARPDLDRLLLERSQPSRARAGLSTERGRIAAIASEIRRLASRYADADPRSVVAFQTLEDLGLTGVALADVVLGLEARFDVVIDDSDIHTWRTVGDVVAFVAGLLRPTRVL